MMCSKIFLLIIASLALANGQIVGGGGGGGGNANGGMAASPQPGASNNNTEAPVTTASSEPIATGSAAPIPQSIATPSMRPVNAPVPMPSNPPMAMAQTAAPFQTAVPVPQPVMTGSVTPGSNASDSPVQTVAPVSVTEAPVMTTPGAGFMPSNAQITEPPVPPPPTDSPTNFPTDYPTISPVPTESPTPAPTADNNEICTGVGFDWKLWYEDATEAAHTCSCNSDELNADPDLLGLSCRGMELYCCASKNTCYETDDSMEYVIANRTDGGDIEISVWRSCTNYYEGSIVVDPSRWHRICHEFTYASLSTVSRQLSDPPLAGCRVTIDDKECNSCTPCEEQNGAGSTGYDCTNIEGIEQLPASILPAGPQTECFLHSFPECSFNGGFVQASLPGSSSAGINAAESGQTMLSVRASLYVVGFGLALILI